MNSNIGALEETIQWHRDIRALYSTYNRADDLGIALAIALVREEIKELEIELAYLEGTEEADEALRAQIAKESCDVIVVLAQLAKSVGFDLSAALKAVNRSNQTKILGAGIREEDGKLQKGPFYEKPDLKDLIRRVDRKNNL